MKNVYCNVSDCPLWEELDKPHIRNYGLSYQPIGNMAIYKGRCSVKQVVFSHMNVRSAAGYEKIVNLCAWYNEPNEDSTNRLDQKILQASNNEEWQADSVDGLHPCNVRQCLYNDAEISRCMRTTENEPIYVDKRLIKDGNDSTEAAVCTSFSNRIIKGHIDITKLAYPTN